MATVLLNNQSVSSNLILLSQIPNIVSVSDSTGGTKATITITVSSIPSASANNQYYITVLNETITNTMRPEQAIGKLFYIPTDTTSLANQIARSLNTCQSINADFDVYAEGSVVYMVAKYIGPKFDSDSAVYATNIGSGYLRFSVSDGTATSPLHNSTVSLVFKENNNYITTLSKNFYNGKADFDISPVLSSVSDYGKITNISASAYYVNTKGVKVNLASFSQKTGPGYVANQSERTLTASNRILLNNKRGDKTQKLYVYGNTIPISVYSTSSSASVSYRLYSNTMTQLSSGSVSISTVNGYGEGTINVNTNTANAFFIEVSYGSSTILFDIIRPINLAKDYRRIYWYNEFGGVSFFDFTGSYSNTDDLDVETYQKNHYDFYTSKVYEQRKIYNNETRHQLTVQSHLLTEEGTWIVNSMTRSKKFWTEINGEKYYLIPVDISAEKNDTYDNLYRINATFEFSYIP